MKPTAWAWVQRGKSRALLDLLYRSEEPPIAMAARMRAIPELAGALLEEAPVLAEIRAASPAGPGDARRRHAAIMDKIRSHPIGADYVDFRAGRSLQIESVDRLFSTSLEVERAGICVDWATDGKHLYMLSRRPGEEPRAERLALSAADVHRFIDHELRAHPVAVRDMLRHQPERLDEMAALVESLARLSRPDELIVLCPTQNMHALPLHALSIGGMPLIARNPVLYTSSLGITRHTILRRDATAKPRDIRLLGAPYEALLESRRLVEELVQMFGADALLGEQVTRAAIEHALLRGGIVHFQGYAVAVANDPLSSYLEAAGKERVTARQIMQLAVSADLVGLGACATGAAVISDGDEPSGLVPALLIAGARSTLSMLWRVHEHSAAFFMRHFYAALLNGGDGVAKVDALRQAMLRTRAEPEFAAPYHWAPYVLHGDWL